MSNLPDSISELRRLVSRMPGFSERGAERFLEWWWAHDREREDIYKNWGEFMKYRPCQKCFFFSLEETCVFCKDGERKRGKICVVTSPFTAALIENKTEYRGLYFVLDGDVLNARNIKAVEGVKNRITFLRNRVREEKISEVIVATDFTSRGEATGLYIKDFLRDTAVEISRLAQGFHPGDSLGYSDPITLKKALDNRTTIDL